MELTRLAGILIVLGFILFWIGNLYSPPGSYTEEDLDVRLQIVGDHPQRWAVSQGLGGVGIAVLLAGLLILSIRLRPDHGVWLTYLPAALNVIAVVLLSVWLYQYITDPASILGSVTQSILILAAALLIVTAGIAYGILFLQFGLPAWLSYLTVGFSAVAVLAIVVARPPSFYVISFYFFIILAAGIALIRH